MPPGNRDDRVEKLVGAPRSTLGLSQLSHVETTLAQVNASGGRACHSTICVSATDVLVW